MLVPQWTSALCSIRHIVPVPSTFSRSTTGRSGGVRNTWAMSTIACREIAKVRCACQGETPSTPDSTSAEVSRIVVTCQPGLFSCWERKYAKTG